MPLPSYVNAGTATCAVGSTAVTGQGTSWALNVRAGDMFGTHKGSPIRIASVNSNTSLTLAYPCTFAQTAAAYEIGITPAASEMAATARQLLETLTNGNLTALAGLASAANKLPYYTGPGAAALADLSAFARTLIAAADAATARATLDAGRRAVASTVSTADWNTVTAPGWHTAMLGAANANAPITGVNFYCFNMWYSGNDSLLQIAYPYQPQTNGIYYRMRIISTWTSWRRLYDWANVIGTVSQSGGVPTGGLVERGANANGDYARFADGTQFAWMNAQKTFAMTTGYGSWYYGEVALTFPAAFSAAPAVVTGGEEPAQVGIGSANAITASGFTLRLADVASRASAAKNCRYVAAGRWF